MIVFTCSPKKIFRVRLTLVGALPLSCLLGCATVELPQYGASLGSAPRITHTVQAFPVSTRLVAPVETGSQAAQSSTPRLQTAQYSADRPPLITRIGSGSAQIRNEKEPKETVFSASTQFCP
jgi:hypothetical protein